MSTIGIKVTECVSVAKCISVLRKYTEASMGELKARIEKKDYVLSCDYIDSFGVRKVCRCYDALTSVGAKVNIYEHDRLTDREFIINLIETYSEIEQDVQAQIDAEAEADNKDQ